MYGTKSTVSCRAHLAQRLASQRSLNLQTRRRGTLVHPRGSSLASSLSSYMQTTPSSTTPFYLRSILPFTSRLYSQFTDEALRNRFADARTHDKVERTANADEPLPDDSFPTEQSDTSPPIETSKNKLRKAKSSQLRYAPKVWKRDNVPLNIAKVAESEKRSQWGYLRHQYPKSELPAVRRQFQEWKAAVLKLGNGSLAKANPEDNERERLYDLSEVVLMREAWEELSVQERQKEWSRVMLATLQCCPSKASMVLEATLDPLPPGYAIHDVLRFIAENLRLDSITNTHDRVSMAEEILALLAHLIEEVPKGHVPFRQNLLGLFAARLPPSQSRKLYEILSRANFKLHKHTRLQFARSMADDAAHKHAAYEVIQTVMEEDGATLKEDALASVVTVLMDFKPTNDGWSQQVQSFPVMEALRYFMERGYTPNTITLTALLGSLCRHGQAEEAVRLALLFSEAGVPLDAKTWTTVFAGAKVSLNVDTVTKALMVAKCTNASLESVLSNVLHAIFYFADVETRNKKLEAPWSIPMFRSMLKLYAKRFELKSLQWWLPDSLPLLLSDDVVDAEIDGKFRDPLGREWDFTQTILPLADKIFTVEEGAQKNKLQPSITLDGVMLRAYIRSLSRPQDILSFYRFFKSRLEDQSQYPSHFINTQGALIHDTFILVMTEHRELWREALHVFGDMLKDSLHTSAVISDDANHIVTSELRSQAIDPDTFKEVQKAAPQKSVHPRPTVFTTTVLLRGLLYQGETRLADHLMQVMRELDITPNLVTWNTLVRHHALAQNTRMTVNLLQRIESEGLKPDMHTYNAFNKLRNQDKALEMMQSILDENRKSIAA